MKKNILTIILVGTAAGALYYAYAQKSRADQCEKTIVSLNASLERMQKIAEVNLNEAILQGHRAADAIKNCDKAK